jgi:hypothetical protein
MDVEQRGAAATVARELAAGKTLTAQTRLIGFEASGPVGGFDDGRPVGPPQT